jgi:Family of unknown function (DUF6152)
MNPLVVSSSVTIVKGARPMNRTRLVVLVSGALFVAAPLFVEAHHSATMFDSTKEVTLEGTVKEFQYTNPHSWLLVDVTNKDGSVTTWGFEAEGPSTLMQRKIRPSDFTFGTKVTITGNPMRDGRPAAMWIKAVRSDGKVFSPRGQQAPQP